MNSGTFKRGSAELHFLLLSVITWWLFLKVAECSPELQVRISWALGASIWALLILRAIGYFRTFRLLPRKSDVFVVLFAVAVGAVIQHELLGTFFAVSLCNSSNLFVWAPLSALIVFGGYYIWSYLALSTGGKRRIVLDLLPTELVGIIEDFADQGLDRYIQFLTLDEYRQRASDTSDFEVDLIVISRGALAKFDQDPLLVRAHLAGIPIMDHQRVSKNLTGKIKLTNLDLWDYLLTATPQTPLRRSFSLLKRIFEPLLALLLLLLLGPVFLLIALIVRFSSPGPVLYRQIRTGHLGKNFMLYKFRSMYLDSEVGGPQWTITNDSRITKIGWWLRRTRLDELPQIWNILRGEMSFFGPRPERPEIYASLEKDIPLFSMRTLVRPGITGWAQVCAGYAASVAQSKTKLEFDLYYIQHMSPRLDLIILLKTLSVVLFGTPESEAKITELYQRVKPRRVGLEIS